MEDTSKALFDDEQTAEPQSDIDANIPVHPYLEEIMRCPNDWQLKKEDPILFKSLQETPYTIVDSNELLEKMMTKLRDEKEVALSFKGSDLRSFTKKNSLILIATRSEVFLVDAMVLKEDIKGLSPLFTTTNVLKVAHPIPKNFSMYMVNMFCLPIAEDFLNSKAKEEGTKIWHKSSLKYFLEKYCKDMDCRRPVNILRYWHKRPLTDEYVEGARMSVQYLLFIYDKLRNALIDQNLVQDVYQECNKICSTMWQHTEPTERSLESKSHLQLYKRFVLYEIDTTKRHSPKWKQKEKQLNKVQMEVLRVLCDWRYTTAEKHDEQVRYLLEDLAIYNIAKALPKDVEEIKKCISPDTPCSLLEENLDNICVLIAKAVEEVSGAPDAEEKVTIAKAVEEVSGAPDAEEKDEIAKAVEAVSGAPDAKEKVEICQNPKKSGRKWRKKQSRNGRYQSYQQKIQLRNILQQQPTYLSGQGAPQNGQPLSLMNSLIGRPTGFIRPQLGPRGMPREMVGIQLPPRPFGW